MTGWRMWQLTVDGTLPRVGRGSGPVFYAGSHQGHDAPAPDCVCGLSIVPDLAKLLDAMEHRAWTVGLSPLHALVRRRGVVNALAHGSRPDVLAYCTAMGDVQFSTAHHELAPPPAGTLRCEQLRVERLYLYDHAAQHADALVADIGLEPVIVSATDVPSMALESCRAEEYAADTTVT